MEVKARVIREKGLMAEEGEEAQQGSKGASTLLSSQPLRATGLPPSQEVLLATPGRRCSRRPSKGH